MNADPSMFNSVMCIVLCFLEFSLSTMIHSQSHLSAPTCSTLHTHTHTQTTTTNNNTTTTPLPLHLLTLPLLLKLLVLPILLHILTNIQSSVLFASWLLPFSSQSLVQHKKPISVHKNQGASSMEDKGEGAIANTSYLMQFFPDNM
jgi:hypothetical protein